MRIGVVRETAPGERRVSLVPDGVARLVRAGHAVFVQSGAGAASYYPDEQYVKAGATVTEDPSIVFGADVVLHIRPSPDGEPGRSWPVPGAVLVGTLAPLSDPRLTARAAQTGLTAFSLDTMPRISRAQSMDVLSSMSTIAGYYAVVWAASRLPKLFPLLMTAAGTIAPARVLVLGAGVAGLQAIATAHRLGATVQAFDTRPVVKEQVESLGASFLTLDVTGAQTAEGYAQQLAEDVHARELALLRDPVAAADVVVTTAQVPGSRAPELVTADMVDAMRPGSVIVDLAAETGGNCARSVPGEVVEAGGVTVFAPLNVPSLMPVHASQLYSRNVVNFLTHLIERGLSRPESGGAWRWDAQDEICRRTCVAHAGEILHEAVRERLAQKGGDADAR
ncbi:MAG: Re/Si-specific NAD(P)(+) transhydrogenase subunit alpha [Actinomycetia bacterium]|nr:Re/Si-specific NAD(P)(+) transhydrogenase subunit alpha [Actinomycetes bacterium]